MCQSVMQHQYHRVVILLFERYVFEDHPQIRYKIYSLYWSVIYASCLILQLVKANTISPITAILIGRKLEIIPAHSEVKLRF
jgi:hypothetical protein